MDSSGYFTPGTLACFFLTFVDLTGQPFDPSDLNAVITKVDSGNILVESDTFGKEEEGIWDFSFNIPNSTTPGRYRLTVTYVVETINGPETNTFIEDFVIAEKGPSVYSLRQVASRAFLEALIGYIQRIPVFDEIIRLNKARTIGELSFPRWNQTAKVSLILNGTQIEKDFTVDYLKGRINFNHALSTYDQATASYNFRWFSDFELDSFIEQGINEVNIYPPQSVYTINDLPDRWMIVSIYAAVVNVYRRWLSDILFLEPAKIFGSLQRAKDISSQIDTLKKNYEEDKKTLLEQKKFGPYLGLTRTITTPEFTLPGGRSRWFRYLFK